MTSRAAIIAGLLAACLASRTAWALPPLSELEADLGRAPAQELAEREYRAGRDSLAAGEADLGVSAFGSLGAAHNHDIIDPTHSYTYDQGMGGAGLVLPLLGSRLRIESGLARDREGLAQLAARAQLTRRDLLGKLRKAYAAYWQAVGEDRLAQAYLGRKARVERELALRTQAHVMLDSDRLQILASFARARSDAVAAQAQQRDALALMRDLTGAPLLGGAPELPGLSSACIARAAAGGPWQERDPELRALRAVIALRADAPQNSPLYPVQSNLQLSVQTEDQVTTGRNGSSVALTWWFQIPLGYRSQRRHLAAAAAERLAGARLEYRIRLEALTERRQSLLAQLPALRQARTLADLRFAAAQEAVRERALRAGGLAGDTLGRSLRAQAARYSAATTQLAAAAALIVWYGDWARFDPGSCTGGTVSVGGGHPAPGSLPVAASPNLNGSTVTAPRRVHGGSSLYIWKSAAWLTGAADGTADAEFAKLRDTGVTTLWISLDAPQLTRAMADPAALAHAVRATERAGFSVGLLLGDPSWILPRGRADLTRILTALDSVPFDGVDLDLEPEQLREAPARLPALLGSLADTLAAARLESPWPLELDINPRDLDVRARGTPFAVLLERLHISPTLMVYAANPERVIAIAAPLIERYRQLQFRVALSLEKSLPRTQSLRSYTRAERRARITRVASGLAAPNFAGLVFELEDGWRDAGLLPAVRH